MSAELDSSRSAVGDAHRPVGREQDLLVRAVADSFLADRGAARAQQFEAGLAATLQFARIAARAGV